MGSVDDLIRLAAARPSRESIGEALALWVAAPPALMALAVQVGDTPWFLLGAPGAEAATARAGEVEVWADGGPPGAAEAVAALVATIVDGDAAAFRKTLHDLRGALAVILGQCEMLAEGLRGPLPERAVPAVTSMRRQAERAADLVDDLTRPRREGPLAQGKATR